MNLNYDKKTHLHSNSFVVLVAHTQCLVRSRAVCTAAYANVYECARLWASALDETAGAVVSSRRLYWLSETEMK
jgi:hypothetical protein